MELDEAYQRQLAHWRAALDSGAHRLGWKVGLNPPQVQEALGLSGPVVGHLTSGRLLGADGSHSLTGAQAPKAEPEIASRSARTGRSPAWARRSSSWTSRRPPPARATCPTWWPRTSSTARWRSGRRSTGEPARWTFSVDGQVVREGDASDYPIADMVHAVADTLEAAGERLESGDRIIAGALAPPPDVEPASG